MLNSGSGSASVTGGSETDCKLTLPRDEEQRRADEGDNRPPDAHREQVGVRYLALVEHLAPAADEGRRRIDRQQPVVTRRNLAGVVEDRRRVEPDPQRVGDEVR